MLECQYWALITVTITLTTVVGWSISIRSLAFLPRIRQLSCYRIFQLMLAIILRTVEMYDAGLLG